MFRRSIRYSCAVLPLMMFAAAASLSVAQPAVFPATTDVIVAGSHHRELYDIAGQPKREILELTKTEVWSIAPEKLAAVEAAAKISRVAITVVDAESRRALVPMAPSQSMTPAQAAMMHDAMKSKAVVGAIMMTLPPAALEEYLLTQGLHGPTREPRTSILLTIADGKTITARRTRVVPVAGGYAWHGVVEGTDEPVTLLWWPSGKLTGSVTYQGSVYAIHDLGSGMHAIVEMNSGRFPDEHAPMDPSMMKKMHMSIDPLVTRGEAAPLMNAQSKRGAAPEHPQRLRDLEDAPDSSPPSAATGPIDISHAPLPAQETAKAATIRVIVAYTKAAASHYQDIATDLIALAIEDANESFRQSGINNVKLELAYTYKTSYVEQGSHFDHVFRFAGKGDGYMDEVHDLRDRYKADVAVLLVDDPNGCGLSAEVHARPERAFAVVHHECAANMYSLAHEIGHLIGARHDAALDDNTTPFAYGHGFVSGKSWRTMMAYKDSCDGCRRIPVWSSPFVRIGGVAAGNAESDNARVIAENAARVASFR